MNSLELHTFNDLPPLLPPPARMILIYAIIGWTCEQQEYGVTGWQPIPERSHWLPVFIRLFAEEDAMPRLRDYCLTGMRYERVSAELFGTVERAFVVPDFDRMLVDALADLSIR